MDTIPERIYELMTLMLDGEQTSDEEQEFGRWLDETPTHRQLWHDYQELRERVKLLKTPFDTNIEAILPMLKQKPSGQSLWRRRTLAWAALFVLPLSVGLWLLHPSGQEEEHRHFSEVAHPGIGKAILQMAGGAEVVLGNGLDSVILTGNGTTIKNDSGNILSFNLDSTVAGECPEQNKLVVPRGGEYRVTLSDGTRVWLNSSTTLSFPQVFSGDTRRVHLSGEAYFEVTSDPRRPFIVSVTGMDIRVLGTSFNVSVYKDEKAMHTTLVEGRVEILTPNNVPCVLVPGKQAYLENGRINVRNVDVRQYTSWVEGRFNFSNATLEEISRQIARWYDTDIFFSSESVKNIRFTGAILRFGPLEDLIRMIEYTSNVRFSVKGKTIIISEVQ